MKQSVYDVLLIGISHLFMIMLLENSLLFFIVEKKFSKELPNEMNKLFGNVSSFDIKKDLNEYIDKKLENLSFDKKEEFQNNLISDILKKKSSQKIKNKISNINSINNLQSEISDIFLNKENLKKKINEVLDEYIFKDKYKFINNEEEYIKKINNYNEIDVKKNNLIIKAVVIAVNVIILLILLYLIYYGKKKTNKIKINWKYLIISNILSIIIIGTVDGIFISSFQGEMFNYYELIKQYINYIFLECKRQ